METVNIVWICIGILVVLGISYMVYKKYTKVDPKQFVPNDEYIPKPKTYECILFYTTWCPHCKKTLKDWDTYKTNNTYDNILFRIIDCDKNPDQADYYQVDSYPTIIMVVDGKNYIFDSNFSKESMDKFVNMILKI
jgi:thiol-disulfide isomerase/thioredoxin